VRYQVVHSLSFRVQVATSFALAGYQGRLIGALQTIVKELELSMVTCVMLAAVSWVRANLTLR